MTNIDNTKYEPKSLTFVDLIEGMPDFKSVLNDQGRLELLGSTPHLQELSDTADQIAETLMLGLQSIGSLYSAALDNTTTKFSRLEMINFGHFVALIGEQSNAMLKILRQVRAELNRRQENTN